MATKPKTKKIPFDRVATETSAGVWEWDAVLHWRWRMQPGRLNLEACIPRVGDPATNEDWQAVAYLPTLKDAAYFTEGFVAGRRSTEV